jgi:hypothetical protein
MAATAAMFLSCDDDTASLGIRSDADAITSTSTTFKVTSRSVPLGAVTANTSKSYLGLVTDPETDTDIRAEFMAQFHTFEDYSLPSQEQLVLDSDGNLIVDSIEIRLYFTDYYGDSDNPMSLSVYELDREKVLREDWTYYSDIDISEYIPAGAEPLAKKVFTVEDYTLSDSERTNVKHSKNVRIMLPKEYGADILSKAMSNPEYFQDSWHFMHNVCPGFAFRLDGGRGTMLTLDVGALNVFFRYTRNDSIYDAIARFAATPEVIQTTSIHNSDLSDLIERQQPFTYIKSPAAIATEITLPVDEVFANHDNDSISRARLSFQRYNSAEQSAYSLNAPSTLLLVPSDSLDNFFKQRRVANGRTAVTTNITSAYNVYTFSNIANLITSMHQAKKRGMIREGLKESDWKAAHPRWNKATVVPVVVKTVTNQNTNAVSQVSVTHDFSLTSTRLIGGTVPLDLYVIYSSYQ